SAVLMWRRYQGDHRMRAGFTRLSIISIFLLLSMGESEVGSQTQRPKRQEPVVDHGTIKIKTELVVVDALVIDKKSRKAIGGIQPQDFALFEDGVEQQIEYFSQDKLPLSIILLIDISPSVQPFIEKIREGALQALQRLKPEDEVALMIFSGWTELIQDFTRDRQLILDKLEAAMKRKGGGTRLHDAAARAALHTRRAANPDSRRVVIAITDNQGYMYRDGDPVSEEEAERTVIESGATVCGLIVRSAVTFLYDVILHMPSSQDQIKTTSLKPYVEQTGGEISGAGKDIVAARLSEMFDYLRSRYSIGYTPTNQNFNGDFRRIRLALRPEAKKRLGGEIVIRAREGYYALDKASEKSLAKTVRELGAAPETKPNEKPGKRPGEKPEKRPDQGANPPPEPAVEQGSPDELKGVTKVFVDKNMEKRHRSDIVKEIQKKLPALEIVSKPEDADIHLKFSLQRKTQYEQPPLDEHPPQWGPLRGVGKALKVVSNNRVRLLLEYEEDRYRIKFGKRNPAGEFAKEFVKAYLGANGKG
ncbi:MAG: VWA domain-containing protein, partial [Blastocatellia bacterium]|nr:VWA domain-containing protein [Blastocatellia bacterium]